MSEDKTTDDDRVEAPVGNEYGSPYVAHRGCGYVIGIENYGDQYSEEPVSREFYDAWMKEFGNG